MIDDFRRPPAQQPQSGFMTPERVAARDALLARAGLAGAGPQTPSGSSSGNINGNDFTPPSQAPQKKSGKTITLFKRWTVSRAKFAIALSLLVLLIGGSAAAFVMTRPDAPVATTVKPAVKAAPAPPPPILSPLTGIPVSEEQRVRPVIGVMVENSGNARPQSGLKDAGIVFEAIAEYGITRFLALFQEQDTANIGPVRSARPYYLDWAMAFDASYAHVGGSPDALQRIKGIGVKDMDQFHNSGAYRRVTTRYAPHNVYTDMPTLRNLAIGKGYATSTYTSLTRKAESPYKAPAAPAPSTGTAKPATPSDARTPATGINFGISGAFYNVHYDYNAAANSYNRVMAGAPHMDADSNTQLSSKVVVGLVMPYSLMADGYHSQYATIGSGQMYVFQDGTVTTGTWSKGEPKEQFVFKDAGGKVIALNPGQTWISVVGSPDKVTYQ